MKKSNLAVTEDCIKFIDSIAERGEALRADIQTAGVAVIEHADLHGDVTLANRLFLALPKDMRRNALGAYLLQFGKFQVRLTPAGKQDKEQPFAFAKDKATDLDCARVTPWQDCGKPEEDMAELEAGKILAALASRIQKDIAAGKTVRGLDESQIAALSQMVPTKVKA